MHGSKLNPQAKKNYVNTYSQIILDDFFAENEDINGQQIISLTPIKQVNFFVLKVLFEEWQEETKKFRSPYFDYKNEEVNAALKTLVNTLSKNIAIQKADFKTLFEKAVDETLDYLYNPSDYLLKEVKKHNAQELTKEIKGNGKYIKLYKELYDGIVHSIENGMSTDLLVVESVVKNAVKNFAAGAAEAEELVKQFSSVAPLDIVEKDEPKPSEQPRKETAISFFDTLDELPTLEEITPDQKKDVASYKEPEDLTEEFTPEKTESQPTPEIEIKPEPKTVEAAPVVKQEETVSVKRKETIEQKSGSLHERFTTENILTLNQRYEENETKDTIASTHESKPISEIASSININQKYLFVNDLFEGNDKDYEAALEQIESSNSFDASVELLVQQYAKKYAWDMNSDEVKELLKVIFKRFR
ncbi:hypothetical protein N6H18_06445 [Reichenbachiella agarivorans]|uniref:Uncharacterized protein n=1 Tax=Reichenbachiella agarivorans TaxID=2979464 RepID=A0ABY6CSV3_9BACT|nr:hypothetical protein [Reichenbachiella agarivorans]UXP33592.1 hypothetical protein N6H18_06445 [Reichenbachiella agarivorans]